MPNWYGEFDSTPANIVADLKARILNSTNWANISGGSGNVMSATTVDGAQMVVDLADAGATSRQIQMGIYRTYTAGAGTDKLTRYLCWHTITGSTADLLHATLSVGQDHLFFYIEGPRGGEPNADDATWGSARQCFFIGRLVPYFTGEPNPVVVSLANNVSLSSQSQPLVYVSRNRANTSSWVPARMGTLTIPNAQTNAPWFSANRIAAGDSNTYLWPYVVIEEAAGLRGRLAKAFFAGLWAPGSAIGTPQDFPPQVYQRLVYNAENYIIVLPHRCTTTTFQSRSAFGWADNSSTGEPGMASPAIAVPTQ